MRNFGRRSLFAVSLAAALMLVPGAAGLAADPTIEATGGVYGFSWSPSSAQVAPGGSGSFKSPSGSIPHGVSWSSGPETPKCSNVPINEGKTSWSGACSFAQAGSYGFYCTVHPTEMKGTITAITGEGPPPTNPAPPPPDEGGGSPVKGSALQALRLAKSQKGNVVRGSIALSEAATGGRLEVALLMAGNRVGRLARGGLSAGRLPFAVALRRVARLALRENGQLSLKVRIRIAPPGDRALILNRTVTVHD
jgi:plastocyanin